MISSRVGSILDSVSALGEPIHVHGATPAVRALLTYQYALRFRPSILTVICATDDAAADFASDLEFFCSSNEPFECQILHFPTWEQSLYSPIAPSIRTRLNRIATLASLALSPEAGVGTTILITSLPAISQATLPREVLEKYSIALKVDESVESREALVTRLLDAGYARTDTVEDPATFAVRGDIIDLFAPLAERPVRIELFVDVIEKMRAFDAGTQRALADAEHEFRELKIPPAREVLINSLTTPLLRERLKQRADDLGISRAVRDPIMSSVQAGVYAQHSDAWGAFAYEKPATLLEYLPSDTAFVWNDSFSCDQEWDKFLEEQNALASDALNSGVIAPAVEQVFLWNSAAETETRKLAKLFLDRIELVDLEEPETDPDPAQSKITKNHRVSVRSNNDLVQQGSRHSLGELEQRFRLWLKQGFKTQAIATTQSQLERIRFLLEERNLVCQVGSAPQPGLITLSVGALSEGFRWPAEGLVLITAAEILGSPNNRGGAKKQRRTRSESGSAAKDWSGLQALSDLNIGDAIVHVDHGIGRYQGLARLDLNGAPSDFLLLEYANKDKLYLPVYRLNVIQKYVAQGEGVTLDKLGAAQFAKAKEQVKNAVRKLAIDLIQLYAERKVRPGIVFSPRDAAYREFEAKFAYDETPDQLRAIDDTLQSMESGQVMDRLVCGDVGYGKTEVAMRAAFRAVSDGRQVAVLVPTTVLCYQHEQSFKARLKDYPLNIESVSRFKNSKENKVALEGAAQGKVDILIGTHRLLSRDVRFKDLGLVIIDEEHRFGVEHKEKLKTLKVNTHVLTLTATPIPRTLHMALAGLRDISLINTAPVDRLPIRTYVSKFDESLIQRAIEFELNRGGQAFFLHNRVQTIYEMANKIRELVPSAKVGVGHGQMSEGELEQAMVDFYQKKTNVLVCTTIIESGLDVPSANTILINRADMLGLAQLYQIRGRVGRAQQRAYAYLLIPNEGTVTEDAKRRLEVIQKFVELGSGFSVASHDLEIRGGGDLLGADQSGHIAAVGFDLYTELLEEAIRELDGKSMGEDSRREPEIKAPFPAFLSEEYVPDVHQRLSLYRRFSASQKEAEIDTLEEELRDRFGELPAEAQNLLWLIRIKLILKRVGIDTLNVGPEKISLLPGPQSKLDPARAIAWVASNPTKFQLMPDSKLVAKVPTGTLRDLFFALESVFKDITVNL